MVTASSKRTEWDTICRALEWNQAHRTPNKCYLLTFSSLDGPLWAWPFMASIPGLWSRTNTSSDPALRFLLTDTWCWTQWTFPGHFPTTGQLGSYGVPTTQPAHIRQVKLLSLLRIPWSRTPVFLCCLFVQQYRGPSPQPLSSLCSLSTVYLMWHAPSRPGNSLSSSVTGNPEGEENNAHLKGGKRESRKAVCSRECLMRAKFQCYKRKPF